MTGFFIVIYEIIYYSENPQTDYRWQIYSTILNPSLPLSILLKGKSKKKKKETITIRENRAISISRRRDKIFIPKK